MKRLVQTLHAFRDVSAFFKQGKAEIAPRNGHTGIDLCGFAKVWLCCGKTIHRGCKLAKEFVSVDIPGLDFGKFCEGLQCLMRRSHRLLTSRKILPYLGHLWRLFECANEVRFRLGVSAKIRQCHAKKHPAFQRVCIELARLLQKFNRLLEMAPALKGHRAREIPSIKILRALEPHFRINSLRLIVLVGLVKGQSFFEQIGSLFVVHAIWFNPIQNAARGSKMHHRFFKLV